MNLWANYGLFFAKTFTMVIALLVLTGGWLALIRKNKAMGKHKLDIQKLNTQYEERIEQVNEKILSKAAWKKFHKAQKAATKAQAKASEGAKRIFVVDFQGDIKASAVTSLREEISAILGVATPQDEVVVRLESPGGIVPAYGLAASQLARLRSQQVPLTVIIDKVAASGGYMMACVANQILAAPFAIIGSIGVVAQIPNFHRFLKNKDIDFEQLTAGEYKRTLTLFGENTPKAREKLQAELEEIHQLFKHFIQTNRPVVDIQQIATGEHWLGSRALELKLIDGLITSDDYLLNASKNAEVYHLHYTGKKSLGDKISSLLGSTYQQVVELMR